MKVEKSCKCHGRENKTSRKMTKTNCNLLPNFGFHLSLLQSKYGKHDFGDLNISDRCNIQFIIQGSLCTHIFTHILVLLLLFHSWYQFHNGDYTGILEYSFVCKQLYLPMLPANVLQLLLDFYKPICPVRILKLIDTH